MGTYFHPARGADGHRFFDTKEMKPDAVVHNNRGSHEKTTYFGGPRRRSSAQRVR